MIDCIKTFDDAITSFFPVLDLIVCEQVVPIPSAKDTVIENAKKIITVLEIAAYFEYMKRTTYLSQVLLFQGGLINGDLEEEFKKAGGNSTMLAEYIRFMFNDDVTKIPVSGATIKNIIDGADNVAAKVKKDIANVESRVALARNTARTTAFRIVMRDYLTKRTARNVEDPSKVATLVERAMQEKIVPIVEVIRQYDVNFMDAAMRAVVTTQYPESFTAHLFDKLGTAYINATEMNGNLSDADIRQIDVRVISKLIITFLVDNLVEPVKA
jgi:phosphopantetheine adenylyltransferase